MGAVENLRREIHEAKRRALEDYEKLEESLIQLDQDHDVDATTAAVLRAMKVRPSVAELAEEVKRLLVASGAITNPGSGPTLLTEDSDEPTILEPWMLRENALQDQTRWFVMRVKVRPQIFRFFRKHLPGQPKGERYTLLIRNLRGQAWRLATAEEMPKPGPGRPLSKHVASGTVMLNGERYDWLQTPSSKTMLGVLNCEEKEKRYAVVRDPSLDVPADEMIPEQYRRKR